MDASASLSSRLGVAQAIDELDLGALGRALWRRKRLIVTLTLAAAAIAFAAVNMMTPRYKSEARVLIETRDNIFLRPDAEKTTERGATVDQEAVTSQVQLLLSRDLAREVVRKLKLGERPEFDPVLGGTSTIRTVLGLLGIAKDPMSQTPEERVFKSYAERIAAYQVEKSRVIAIEFESEDPELAAQAVNAVAEGYLVLQQAAKQEQSRAASQWLAGEIDSLRKKVADAEAKVEQYRSKTNLFVGNNNTTLSNQQLGDFNGQLASARAQRSDAEAKARMIREALRNGLAGEFSDIVNSELIRRLSEQRVTLRAQLAEQSSTLLDQHPRIKELRAQIADLERQMRVEADRLARSFENDAKLSAAKVESLSVNLEQLKRQAANSNEQDVQLRALERDAKSQRDLLESLLGKYREATARDSIGAASPDARVISSGIVSNTPSWPKKVPTVLVAALATLALSIGFVTSAELLRAASSQPAARERAPSASGGKPLVAGSPAPTFSPRFLDEGRASAGVALERIEALARELGEANVGTRRIAVLGVRRSIGSTMAAITLARTLARNAKVVLVDLALGAPNLAVIASDAAAPGIGELVLGSASFGQIITRDRYSRVHIITAGRAAIDARAVVASQRLAITLEALARSYDYVVVDAGVLADVSAERVAQLLPRAVLVADALDAPGTAAARELLLAVGFADVGVLESAPQGPHSVATSARAA
ncbi:MAG: tyrosine-protein kinase Etk/Wzc [Alphaproteobacteria bacterium]|jgi:uncharacterized protein involved in exopolysaccharide biosynthesis/Mrp family chromosome partitioning ATPase|nr:tyrosine-protein kinase Etk/Wzc [Alphaproteobacteria bacterium]